MDENEQVTRILREWNASADHAELRAMALSAVRAMNGPREWGPGDTIPPEADYITDGRHLRWAREQSVTGAPIWVCSIPDREFLERIGVVTESDLFGSRPETPEHRDESLTQPGVPKRDQAWLDSNCWARQPQHGWTCDRARHGTDPEDKATWHHNIAAAKLWHPDREPVNAPTARHPASPPPRECPECGARSGEAHYGACEYTETPAADPDPFAVISGTVVEILDAAGAKLRKLKDTYKGSATRGAGKIADMCDTAAASLRDLTSEGTKE